MDFSIDAEQEALRSSVRALLGKVYESTEARREVTAEDPGFSEDTWSRLAELGVLGLPFAEEDGGFGAGPVEVSLVAEEFGRVIAPEPFVEAIVLAGGLIAELGSAEQRSEWIEQIAAGELIPTFAWLEPGQRWTAAAQAVTATASGDSWTLSGVKEPVIQGGRADLLLVSAAIDGGTAVFAVAADADGLTRDSYKTHDGGRAARVSFNNTPAVPLGSASDATAAINKVLDRARIAYANEAVGAMAVALDITVGYLKTRKQFGVTLNRFQALNFRAADLYVSLELVRSTVQWATMVLDAAAQEALVNVSSAASHAALQVSRAGRHIGQDAIQLHGGIGVTAEYSVGHYTSRLTAIEHLIGDATFHRARLAAGLTDHGAYEPLGSEE